MRRLVNENEESVLGTGYRLLKDKVTVFCEKSPCMRKVYKVYRSDNLEEKEFSYCCFSLKTLSGFFDGYYKGLNSVYERKGGK